jgi:hypothetical protein
MTRARRQTAFALLAAVCTLGTLAAIAAGIGGGEGAARDSAAVGASSIVYRSAGRVAVAPLRDGRPGRRELTGLRCERIHFAAGRGLCLTRGRGFAAGYRAEVVGPDLRVLRGLDVAGVPSRARVSPDGRNGSVTLFVAGHAYTDAGSFSTQTTLIDLASGTKIADLEQFTVLRDGRQVTAVDRNFWGVTFARDSDRFYATMATGGRTYLIEGSVRGRSARVIHANVECPSLSPDGTRIAYKRRPGVGSAPWRLAVLDLADGRETLLSETRNVDDQVEWLDSRRVLYGVDGAVWSAPADGSGAPSRFLAGAGSPAVVRG